MSHVQKYAHINKYACIYNNIYKYILHVKHVCAMEAVARLCASLLRMVDISGCALLWQDLETGPFSPSSASLINERGTMGFRRGQSQGLRLPLANANQGCEQQRFPQVN